MPVGPAEDRAWSVATCVTVAVGTAVWVALGSFRVHRLRRRRRDVVLEVPVEDRPRVLRRYLQAVPGDRPHIPVAPDAPLAEFDAIAGRHPAFRAVPVRA